LELVQLAGKIDWEWIDGEIALDLGSVEGIQLPATLALLLGADLIGPCERPLEPRLDVRLACDLAADVADDATKPAAQDAQFATVALELLGIAPRHHDGALGDAQIGLPQSHAVLSGQAIEPLDRRMQELGVGRERNGLGLHRGVHGDASKVVGLQRAGVVRDDNLHCGVRPENLAVTGMMLRVPVSDTPLDLVEKI
jgi:hypothetical protein